jgi:peptidyl-lysine (3S)-dioxygenase / protease
MSDPISNLISTYHELNANVVDILDEEPSALEFMRFVAKNRPFIVRGAATQWSATRKWDAAYLREVMAEEFVNVAVTPKG